jgi:hypothetical protein
MALSNAHVCGAVRICGQDIHTTSAASTVIAVKRESRLRNAAA